MAIYFDQFDRVDPFEFKSDGEFNSLINALAADARSYLHHKTTVAVIIATCRCLEHELDQLAVSGSDRDQSLLEALSAPDELALRKGRYLFKNVPSCLTMWEPFAILALWALVDVMDASSRDDSGAAASSLVLATKALQACSIVFGATLARDYIRIGRSEKTSASINTRWERSARTVHWLFAMELAPTILERDRLEVARQLADAVYAKFGKQYADETVNDWLIADGWKAPPK